jgi:hypothetical protein
MPQKSATDGGGTPSGRLWQWGVMNRSVSLTLTADDYAAANQLHCLKCFRTRSAVAFFAMLILAYVIWMTIAHIDRRGAIGVIALNAIFVAVVALLIANYFLFIPISTRRTYRKHKALHRPYIYSWSQTELTVTSSSGEWHVAWSDYLKWDENALVFHPLSGAAPVQYFAQASVDAGADRRPKAIHSPHW